MVATLRCLMDVARDESHPNGTLAMQENRAVLRCQLPQLLFSVPHGVAATDERLRLEYHTSREDLDAHEVGPRSPSTMGSTALARAERPRKATCRVFDSPRAR